MTPQEILANINKIIISENGLPINMGNHFVQSELDSLGTMIALLTITDEFNINSEELDDIVIKDLKVIDLVDLCKSSITNV